MLRFLADENFDGRRVDALLEREPSLDIVRVQDVGLMKTPDRDILQWTADEGRVLLTHDIQTMPYFAFERVRGPDDRWPASRRCGKRSHRRPNSSKTC
jgi:hypothetical protein